MSVMIKTEWIALFALTAFAASAQSAADRRDWVPIFNGKNLDGWTVKLAHHEVGDNFGDTFRVENGVIKVSYDKYPEFGTRFGHAFWKDKLSHYRARGVSLRGRTDEGRTVLCAPQFRHHDSLAGAADHSQGTGLADFGGGAVHRQSGHRFAPDFECLHARHGDFHEGRNGKGALHEFDLEGLPQ